jgi:ABC-type nitrate/sulfonate/bicarbonate transport system permease component
MPASYPSVPPEHQVGTAAAAFAHIAAESLGVTGGLLLCLWAVVRRMRLDAVAAARP